MNQGSVAASIRMPTGVCGCMNREKEPELWSVSWAYAGRCRYRSSAFQLSVLERSSRVRPRVSVLILLILCLVLVVLPVGQASASEEDPSEICGGVYPDAYACVV